VEVELGEVAPVLGVSVEVLDVVLEVVVLEVVLEVVVPDVSVGCVGFVVHVVVDVGGVVCVPVSDVVVDVGGVVCVEV
jgi:hypothetical protein